MPKGKRTAKPLSDVARRIAEAERKMQTLHREYVGIDAEGYENVAVLVERGFGKKVEVLRQALAAGLRAMKNGSEPDDAHIQEFMESQGAGNSPIADAIKDSVVDIGPPILIPPSQLRINVGEEGSEGE